MGFWFDEIATEWKQHINLSESAWIVIEEDIHNFYNTKEEESFSGFLNRVFINYYHLSDASISLRCEEKKEELHKIFTDNSSSKIIDKYIDFFEKALVDKKDSYKSGEGRKYRINKESLELLKESNEDSYYDGVAGKYLKAIFEEYSTKPNYIREQIFFADTINTITAAIANQRRLKITIDKKVTVAGDRLYERKFYVAPYKIVQDPTNTYNYLIGYSKEIREDAPEEDATCCLRISRINKISILSSMGAKISKERAKLLEEEMIKKTPMFMSSNVIKVVVRFSDKGLETLRRITYMRPRYYKVDENDKYLYTFECTEIQAINYFVRFGWDACILEPESLHDTMKKRIERTLMIYEGMDKKEIISKEMGESKNGK